MREEIYLLSGSNVGDREANMSKALDQIRKEIDADLKVSKLYETAAWGKTDQDAFLNQGIAIRSTLAPGVLLAQLKEIEKQTGRIHTEKWGPRVIDLDILFYGAEIIQTPALQIPHPYLPVRRFALLPLSEIAGEFVHPVLKKTVRELLAECPDRSEVSVM